MSATGVTSGKGETDGAAFLEFLSLPRKQAPCYHHFHFWEAE